MAQAAKNKNPTSRPGSAASAAAPSKDGPNWLVFALACVGMVLSGYLTYSAWQEKLVAFCTAGSDCGSQSVAVISLVGEDRTRARGQRQNLRRGSDVGDVPGRQAEHDRPAQAIGQRVDLGRSPASRAADGLRVLPPFPPEALR